MAGLRIIAGEARGRKLKTLKSDDLSVRPILGRIKKSLFDILNPKISDSSFLDLYAGTGAVGLEALSRGCKTVIFVEQSSVSIKLIKENLKFSDWEKRSEIFSLNVIKDLSLINRQFDLIFSGVPYKDEKKKMLALTGPTLESIEKENLLKSGGWIIAQHHIKEPIKTPDTLKLFRKEKYGDSILTFYEKAE